MVNTILIYIHVDKAVKFERKSQKQLNECRKRAKNFKCTSGFTKPARAKGLIFNGVRLPISYQKSFLSRGEHLLPSV